MAGPLTSADVVKALLADVVMAVSADVEKAVSADVEKRLRSALESWRDEASAARADMHAHLDWVERLAAPPGPVRRSDPRASAAARRAAEIARLRKVADEVGDPVTRRGYLSKVAALEEEGRSVASARVLLEREGRR